METEGAVQTGIEDYDAWIAKGAADQARAEAAEKWERFYYSQYYDEADRQRDLAAIHLRGRYEWLGYCCDEPIPENGICPHTGDVCVLVLESQILIERSEDERERVNSD